MPRIFDNIDQRLLPTLKTTMRVSHRSDFCVGYFNLRGWRQLDEHIEQWAGGHGDCCGLLVGMQTLPQQELAEAACRPLSGPVDFGRAYRRRRSWIAPAGCADKGWQGRGETASSPPSAREAIPSVPALRPWLPSRDKRQRLRNSQRLREELLTTGCPIRPVPQTNLTPAR